MLIWNSVAYDITTPKMVCYSFRTLIRDSLKDNGLRKSSHSAKLQQRHCAVCYAWNDV